LKKLKKEKDAARKREEVNANKMKKQQEQSELNVDKIPAWKEFKESAHIKETPKGYFKNLSGTNLFLDQQHLP